MNSRLGVAEGLENSHRRLKAACDQCHAAKVKCSGQRPHCSRCIDTSLACHYSFAARMGKPPGSKNKKTLERMLAAEPPRINHRQQQFQPQHQQRELANSVLQPRHDAFLAEFGQDDFSSSPQTFSDFSLSNIDGFLPLSQGPDDIPDRTGFEDTDEGMDTSPPPATNPHMFGLSAMTVGPCQSPSGAT